MNIGIAIKNLLDNNLNFSDILVKEGENLSYRLPSGYARYTDDAGVVPGDITAFLNEVKPSTGSTNFNEDMRTNGGHLDFAITYHNVRFRCNLFVFGGVRRWGMSLRKLNDKIPALDTLALPKSAKALADRATGLVLCTGATGSGKSTTLASMVDHINRTRNAHIITLEDPIEYIHHNQMASVTQREVGGDVSTFANGLKASLREDPDVILIGEIRDKQTCIAAMAAAETGHLVMSTLHTTSAPKTVERLLDFFEGDEKKHMQSVISSVLGGIISQVLIPSVDRSSRVLVTEVMINSKEIENTIRNDKMQQLPNAMLNGIKDGQTLMNKELARCVLNKQITIEDARNASYSPSEFEVEYKNAKAGI